MQACNSQSPHFEIITGSERASGNTEQVAQFITALLDGFGASSGVICLREHRIERCGGCGQCNTRQLPCHINDDMPALVGRLAVADALVYIAPVHGYGMAHPMQTFIERAGVGYLRFERPLANKVAGAVVTGRRYSHEAVWHQFNSNFLLNRMILVGSGYPAVVHGGAPGSAMRDTEGLESIRSLVRRMVGMTQLLRSLPASARDQWLNADTVNERQAPMLSSTPP